MFAPVCGTGQVLQLHALLLGKSKGWIKRNYFFPPNNPDGFQTQLMRCGRSRINVVGVGTAKREERLAALLLRCFQIIL